MGQSQKTERAVYESFSKSLKGTKYGEPEDSTSSITIKVVDKKHSKIIRSCDFAIIYYLDDDNLDNGYRYIKNWKKNNRYSFEDRVLSQNADCKLQEILEYEQGWNCVRDEYIKLKIVIGIRTKSPLFCIWKVFIMFIITYSKV